MQNNPRIITGIYKGKKLLVPSSARPITDRVKKTLIDMLQGTLENTTCIDVFAGSGSIGIEALSNGAKVVDFVDSDPESIEILGMNLKDLPAETYNIYHTTVLEFIESHDKQYDILFVDPPFQDQLRLQYTIFHKLMNTKSLLVVKLENKGIFDGLLIDFKVIEKKVIGKNVLYFLMKKVTK